MPDRARRRPGNPHRRYRLRRPRCRPGDRTGHLRTPGQLRRRHDRGAHALGRAGWRRRSRSPPASCS